MIFDRSSFDDASPQDFHFNDLEFQMDAKNFHMDTNEYQQYTPGSSVAGRRNAAAMHGSPGAQMEPTFTNDAMALGVVR